MNDITVPKNPAHRREWVKYQLGIRGLTVAALGRQYNVTRTTAYVVFRRPYPRMEKAIARALQMQPHEIWPERYRPDGSPKSGWGERRADRAAESSKKEVA